MEAFAFEMPATIEEVDPQVEIADLKTENAQLKEQQRKANERIVALEKALEVSEKAKTAAEKLSVIDGLTKAFNRRGGEMLMDPIIEKQSREETHLLFVMFDIDKFKDLNDKYGHLWGDKTLTDFASKIIDVKRNSDIFYRYGGEEFVLAMSMPKNTTPEQIAEVLKKYSEAIQTLNRADPNQEPDNKTPLTASIGVAIVRPGESFSFNDIQSLADKNLYTSKHSGRNATTLSYSSEPECTWQIAKIPQPNQFPSPEPVPVF